MFNYQNNKDIINPVLLGILVFLIFASFTGYLFYSSSKEIREYNQMMSSIEEEGYVFAIEFYRLPVKKVVDKICNKSDVVFLYKNRFFSYKEIQDIEEVYIKKDLFCKT